MQHKNAMDRIKRLNCANNGPQLLDLPQADDEEIGESKTSLLPSVEAPQTQSSVSLSSEKSIASSERSPLTSQVIAAMKVIVPLKILLLSVKIALLLYFLEDIQRLLDVWYMPLLGVLAACLANCVPIGGGIVYVPALAILGSGMKLGVSFSVATMTVGNGIFGYLNWQRKDSSLLMWEAIPFTVLPSSIGTLASLLFEAPPEATVKIYFALFCFLLAVFVFLSVHKGGIANVVDQYSWSRRAYAGTDHPTTTSRERTAGVDNVITLKDWLPLTLVSFFAGFVLVPNIAIGPSLTTFLGLVLLGRQEDEAMVTGIVVGGWASIVPFLLHVCYYRDVPWDLWLMVLPGVACGAWLAPQVQALIGIQNSLIAFGVFLLCTFVLFMTH